MAPVVYGGTLAALVAALRLAESGDRVTFVSPSPRVGGHFGGTSIGEHPFDVGLVIFEFGTFNAADEVDVIDYDPDARNDCGRFVRALERWVRGLGVELHRTPRFALWHDGRRIPDFLFDTRIEGLAELPDAMRARIDGELASLAAGGAGALHARYKYADPSYASRDLATASRANHGDTLHDAFVAPFCRKVTGGEPDALLALWSRAAWLPLYWPETALRGARGDADALPDVPFHVVAGGAVRHLVDTISARLRAHPNVRTIVGSATRVERRGATAILHVNDERIETRDLVWGADADALVTAAGAHAVEAPERIPVTVGLALVRRDAIRARDVGTTIVPHGEHLPYRITNQSVNAGADEPLVRVSCEWHARCVPGDDASCDAAVRAALVETAMIDDPAAVEQTKIVRVPKALVLPTAGNRERIAGARDAVGALGLPLHLVGPAAGFGASSLNDHLVQGLQAAARIAGARRARSAA
jgi:protoporphyrinogen oxidase